MLRIFQKSMLIIWLLFAAQNITGQTVQDFYTHWDGFLRTYVNNGKVDYAGIKVDPAQLNLLVEQIEDIQVLSDDPLNYQAFWINAYNLTVIKSVVALYPIASPLDHQGFFDEDQHLIAGLKVTLNEIEDKFLRQKFKDPRHHFVLVCGAQSCPPLIAEAYRPKTLAKQLDRQTRASINNDQFIRIGAQVGLSQIFDWYAEDFQTAGGVLAFVNKYRDAKVPEATSIYYYPYDWSLNKK